MDANLRFLPFFQTALSKNFRYLNGIKSGTLSKVVDKRENGGYTTPVECVGDFATFISRIRQDSTIENGLNLWCVSDNLRKGAALNAVQIAEVLAQRCLQKG